MSYLYIFTTVLLASYTQIVLKWRVAIAGAIPEGFWPKVSYVGHLMIDPWLISAFWAACLGSLAWIAALSNFELSFAYPFMSLSFVLVLCASLVLFGEAVSAPKIIGTAVIVSGIVILTRH